MKKIGFALIGKGKMGARWSLILGKELLAVFGRDYTITSKNTFDAVLIATPHKYHALITRLALKAGKHVLCEKPGAISSREIKNNIELAKKMGLTYMIGYNCRFHDGFIQARKLYKKGVIGDILFIRATFGFGGREGYEKEWRINKELSGGGHLHDQGVHMIDMVMSFMGKIDKVQGMRSDTYWGSGTEDNAFVLLKSGKSIASIHSSVTQWKRKHTFEIYGTKGYLIIEGLGKRYGEPEKLIVGKRTKNSDVVKERIIKCDSIADHSLKLELKEFLSAIKQGRQTTPSSLDAYKTLKIVEEVYRKDRP